MNKINSYLFFAPRCLEPAWRIKDAVSEVTSAIFSDLKQLSFPSKLFSIAYRTDESELTEIFGRLHHLAIIPDGNRTWGRKRGLTPAQSHRYVVDTVIPNLMSTLYAQGLHTLTIWLFSTENWKRGGEEVENLMQMLEEKFGDICLPICHEHKVRVVHLGRKDRLPKGAKMELERVEKETAEYNDHVFNVAIDYGGEDEVRRAVAKMEKGQGDVENYLDTKGQSYPSPDFIIRTSGQKRLSGFMPWQSCYSELYFEKRPFPEMSWEVIRDAIGQYALRQRRYGG